MVEDDEPFSNVPKVGIPPPVLTKVSDKNDKRKGLQNALKHFMSWEPIKFNFNYIIQRDQTIISEELPVATEVTSSKPIVFSTEKLIPAQNELELEQIKVKKNLKSVLNFPLKSLKT